MYCTVNARVCAEYLRSIGVNVPDEQAQAWAEQEKETRRRKRAHKAELKRSCGHFRTHETRIYSDRGSVTVTYCSDCRIATALHTLRLRAPPASYRLMHTKAQLAVATAKVALTNALAALDDEALRVPLSFTVDPGPPRSPHDGPLSIYVDSEGLRMAPIGLDLHSPGAVRMTWSEIEDIGADLTLHERLVRESESMDEDLRFLRRLYFRHGGVLRFKLKGAERRPRHPRVHDIRIKLRATNWCTSR